MSHNFKRNVLNFKKKRIKYEDENESLLIQNVMTEEPKKSKESDIINLIKE